MGYSGWVCDCDCFWVVENNLVYLRSILVGLMIVIVSYAVANNSVYLRAILVGSVIVIVSGLLRIT